MVLLGQIALCFLWLLSSMHSCMWWVPPNKSTHIWYSRSSALRSPSGHQTKRNLFFDPMADELGRTCFLCLQQEQPGLLGIKSKLQKSDLSSQDLEGEGRSVRFTILRSTIKHDSDFDRLFWMIYSMMRKVPCLPTRLDALVQNVFHKDAIIFMHLLICLQLFLEAERTFDG